VLEQLIGLLGESRRNRPLCSCAGPGARARLEFTLTPEDVQSPVSTRILSATLAWVTFGSPASTHGLRRTSRKPSRNWAAEGLRLILDLRNNPGGLLPVALETASLFLKPGQPLLTVSGRAVAGQQEKVPDDATPYTFPAGRSDQREERQRGRNRRGLPPGS